MRVQGRALGTAVNRRFGFENVRSIVDLAAPWFIGAAMGLQVLGTFWVGQRSFMVGGMLVAAGSELDGLRMGTCLPKRASSPSLDRKGRSACAPAATPD